MGGNPQVCAMVHDLWNWMLAYLEERCGFVLNGERLEWVSVISLAIIMAKNIEDARLVP